MSTIQQRVGEAIANFDSLSVGDIKKLLQDVNNEYLTHNCYYELDIEEECMTGEELLSWIHELHNEAEHLEKLAEEEEDLEMKKCYLQDNMDVLEIIDLLKKREVPGSLEESL